MRFLEPRRGSPEVSPAGAGMPGEVKADEDLTTCRLQVVWFVSAGGWILGAFLGEEEERESELRLCGLWVLWYLPL